MMPTVWSAWDAWSCDLKYFWGYKEAVNYCKARAHVLCAEGRINVDTEGYFCDVLGKVDTVVDDQGRELFVIETIDIE